MESDHRPHFGGGHNAVLLQPPNVVPQNGLPDMEVVRPSKPTVTDDGFRHTEWQVIRLPLVRSQPNTNPPVDVGLTTQKICCIQRRQCPRPLQQFQLFWCWDYQTHITVVVGRHRAVVVGRHRASVVRGVQVSDVRYV